MFPKPLPSIKLNTVEFEITPQVKPTGFREYDARWRFPEEINLLGIQVLGQGLGTLLHRLGITPPAIVVGHDYRAYSLSIKQALTLGLMSAGCDVHDIGLALSPMAYFAQFELDVPGVAMVTASHNNNGWTGVKMGCNAPLTFGPDEMSQLKQIVLEGDLDIRGGGHYRFVPDFIDTYLAALTDRPKLTRPLRVVAASGNGTAGAFAPRALTAIGAEVIPLNAQLDYNFPNHNPNPEDLKMLNAVRDRVLATKADVGLAFDGDGDRCGVIDNEGEVIFADKIGVLLARDFSARFENAKFVVDVKSTGLFETDPVLIANGATTEYWKTGHSYIKRRSHETGALAGFEKSGHYFFNEPIGKGYDDGIAAGFAVLDMLDRNPGKTMADLRRELPLTWQSPTMSPHCRDEDKYGIVDKVVAHFEAIVAAGEKIAGQNVRQAITINGIRIVLEDGTWGLIRASSNTPNLVVVCESPTSDDNMRAMFAVIDAHLSQYDEIGEYDQKI
ncbi:MAG: phosphomannomutase/phosphoglucomutase [Rhizobiales bacterium]|nr:phosphomannomutase/phosphoglucomutase [Hyphomicrobiales bacterium]